MVEKLAVDHILVQSLLDIFANSQEFHLVVLKLPCSMCLPDVVFGKHVNGEVKGRGLDYCNIGGDNARA